MRLAILELEGDGAAHDGDAINAHVKRSLGASAWELSEVHAATNRGVFDNLVDWAKANLTENKLHEILHKEGGHNVYRITPMGREHLERGRGMLGSTSFVTPDYRRRRDRLTTHFPTAHDFLVGVEHLHTETERGFYVSTDQNVHLYLEERFLVYIRLDALSSSRPSLIFSPRPHNDRIKEGTRRAPELLYPKPLFSLVETYRGGSGGWAKRDKAQDVDVLRILAGAPEAFFSALLAELRLLPDTGRGGSATAS